MLGLPIEVRRVARRVRLPTRGPTSGRRQRARVSLALAPRGTRQWDSAVWSITAASDEEHFEDAACLGDVDGDGSNDVALGLVENSLRTEQGGAIGLMTGPLAGALGEATAVLVFGPADGLFAGSALTAIPDQDGDGGAELLVAVDQPNSQTTATRVSVDLLPSTAWLAAP